MAFKISNEVAWQKYDSEDLFIVLNRKTHNFFHFVDTAKFIMELIFFKKIDDVNDLISICDENFSTERDIIEEYVKSFINTISEEGIIIYARD